MSTMDIDSNDVRKRTSGFTLIEILVVAGILGLLSSLGLNSFFNAQKQARDTQRKANIVQYQTALENYANNHNGKYPRSAAVPIDVLCTYLGLTNCPKDPILASSYYYSTGATVSDGAPTAGQYAVWGQLEGQTGYNWMGCSNGQVGTSGTSAGTTQSTLCTVGSTPRPSATPTPTPTRTPTGTPAPTSTSTPTHTPTPTPTPTPVPTANCTAPTTSWNYCFSTSSTCGTRPIVTGYSYNGGACTSATPNPNPCAGQPNNTCCGTGGCGITPIGSCYFPCTRPVKIGTCQNQVCVTP